MSRFASRTCCRSALFRTLGLGLTIAVGAAPATAMADPVFVPPVIGKGRFGGGGGGGRGGDDGDRAVAGLVAEARILGVAGADHLTAWPDRLRGLEPNAPELVVGRAGVVAHLTGLPLSFVARFDLAEPLQPRFADDGFGVDSLGAEIAAVVDDLYVMWRPWRALSLVGGRARVPFSKLRQYEEVDLPNGATPFVVDRIAPDRRTGVTLVGDVGAIGYAAGVYEDLDALEPRAVTDDPSQGGMIAALGHVEWTPIAPMMGSNPLGKVVGARGPLPTPRADPWFDTVRFSLGLGALYRRRDDGSARFDATVSVQLKWRWIGGIGEVIAGNDSTVGEGRELGAWGEVYVTPADRVVLSARAEWDSGAGAAGEWSTGAGISWFATRDRRSKIGFFGWLRRDVDRGTALDGAVVVVQAAL